MRTALRTNQMAGFVTVPSWEEGNLQLFRERLSYKRGNAYALMSKVIVGNGDFTVSQPKQVYSCFRFLLTESP